MLSAKFLQLIDLANKLLFQERHTPHKIYSLHEPEVQCIAKGKTRIRYGRRSDLAAAFCLLQGNQNSILLMDEA